MQLLLYNEISTNVYIYIISSGKQSKIQRSIISWDTTSSFITIYASTSDDIARELCIYSEQYTHIANNPRSRV